MSDTTGTSMDENTGCGALIAVFVMALTLGFLAATFVGGPLLADKQMDGRYCTEFAPYFRLSSNGTWECTKDTDR